MTKLASCLDEVVVNVRTVVGRDCAVLGRVTDVACDWAVHGREVPEMLGRAGVADSLRRDISDCVISY